MRFFVFFQLFSLILLPFSFSANASSLWDYIWGPPDHNEVRPYLEEAKVPHNSRWADDEWTPQDWVDARGGDAISVVNGFYDAGIIHDQYFDDDVPVLEVGHRFLELGSQDQRRVVAFMDDVFNVTSSTPAGVINICLEHESEYIGQFSADGLQLQ